MVQTIKIDRKDVNMIAHRGLSGLERENTCAAFVAAGNRSYFGIETDIHRTSDGRFVLFHDDTTQRLADLDWNVEAHSMEELRTLRLKDMDGNTRGDLVLPTLEEYIRICKKYGKTAVLELKNPFAEADIQTVVEIIRQEGWLDHTTFISFYLNNMAGWRNGCPAGKNHFHKERFHHFCTSGLRTGRRLNRPGSGYNILSPGCNNRTFQKNRRTGSVPCC